MLSLLHIENIAVIEQADITFDAGFNVLTGETGAGKSIVIDAIGAILGERTYRDVIRTGAKSAFVSAVFYDVPELPWFAENHIPWDRELLIQREIHLDGKNLCRVNSMPVTVSLLRQLGMQLVNIHGQHDSQQLFDESSHLFYLDQFARNEKQRESYFAAYDALAELDGEIDRLSMDEGEKLRRMQMLQDQIKEIEQANIQPEEDTALEQRRKLLQSAEKLADGLNSAVCNLYGDDSSDGAAGMIADAQYAISRICDLDERLEAIHGRLTDLRYQAQDVAEELRDLRDSFSFSEEELEQIESRLALLRRLGRKYGAACTDILDYLQRAKTELDEMEFSADRLEQLKAKRAELEKAALAAAKQLHDSRQAAAKQLEKQILQELSQLDMTRVQFTCEFEAIPLCHSGADAVRFLMSANAGEALKPLSKIASGGELARIMLAMKNVLAQQDAVPTLIFDEVDAGVSGRAAQKVAEKLLQVAQCKQVLCVTHLPQIAAMADCHLRISKAERDGRTFTSVEKLDFKGRQMEVARIIGGASITETTLQSAAEMLYRT